MVSLSLLVSPLLVASLLLLGFIAVAGVAAVEGIPTSERKLNGWYHLLHQQLAFTFELGKNASQRCKL
jgi:hypothetical protein